MIAVIFGVIPNPGQEGCKDAPHEWIYPVATIKKQRF